jgi:hypothetical protein
MTTQAQSAIAFVQQLLDENLLAEWFSDIPDVDVEKTSDDLLRIAFDDGSAIAIDHQTMTASAQAPQTMAASAQAWVITAFNAESLYAYGTQDQVGEYLGLLNCWGRANLYEATGIPEDEVPEHPATWVDLTDPETQDWLTYALEMLN